jgi:mannose-6-phosphate isomerase-like protein (cupin superfamily)
MKHFVSNLSLKEAESFFPILTADNALKMKSGIVTLQPDEAVGTHSTDDKEELIIVMEGIATIEIEGSYQSEVETGSVAYIPNRTQHNVLNRTRSKLRYIYVASQAE